MYSLSIKTAFFSMLLLNFVLSTKLKSTNPKSTRSVSFSGDNNLCSNDSTCPTWFTCNTEKRCQCDRGHTTPIICDNQAQISAVLNCNCVTYDSESKSTYAGPCLYNCQQGRSSSIDRIAELPKNPESLVNASACTPFHRTGLLCGDCEVGHNPLIFSYNLSCVDCPDGHKNWWKFILVGFVPLTVFYLFIVVFNINVTSSCLHGVVWYSQFMSSPALVRVVLLVFSKEDTKYLAFAKLGYAFYSMWNLDIFRSILPNICLNVTTLQALALEYLLAFYPFLLILVSYLLIVLYDRRVPVILTLWKPFNKVLAIFRKSWDIRTSVLDSFATFFLLSYMKILNVTADILIPTQIFQLSSDKSMLGVYYSPTVPYFGEEHLPYAILAIILVTLFVSVPTIIFTLYPCKFFQKFLSLFPINWHFLHAFVDSFQGCYKDGTEPGTHDCRWFSVPMLLVWPIFCIVYSLTLSTMFFAYSLIILLILLIAIINIQPLKRIGQHYPLVDIIFIFLFCFFHIALLGKATFMHKKYNTFYESITTIAFLTAVIPIIYTSFLIGSWLFSKIKKIVCIPRAFVCNILLT